MRTPTRPRSTRWTDRGTRSPNQTGSLGLRALGAIVAVIASLAALAGCSSNQSKNNGGGHSPPANVAPAVASSENPRVQDPESLFSKINPNNNRRIVKFDPNPGAPSYLISHAQGIARFRGTGYDFHIISYSDVRGKYGYVYIASDSTNSQGKSLHSFTLKVPETPIQFKTVSGKKSAVYNPHFNHPGGIQVIGDYLAVPVIPYHTANGRFYDSAIVYLYNLSSLKGPSPKAPSEPKTILKVPTTNGGPLQSVGITRLADGRFALGLVAQKNLDIYISSNAPVDLSNAEWKTRAYTYKLVHMYQTNGLFLDTAGNTWMVGFEGRGSTVTGVGGKDIVDLYRLQTNGTWVPNNSTLTPTPKEGKHVNASGTTFVAGGGIEILGPNQVWLYAVDMYYRGGGIMINYWTGPPHTP